MCGCQRMATITDGAAFGSVANDPSVNPTPLVALQDQGRANLLSNWFFRASPQLLRGNDVGTVGGNDSPVGNVAPPVGVDFAGRTFFAGLAGTDTSGTAKAPGTVPVTPAMIQLSPSTLLLLGLAALLVLRR